MSDPISDTPRPAIQSWTVGSLKLFSLNDGLLNLPAARFVNVPQRREATPADVGDATVPIPVNGFLLSAGAQLMLMDAGCGASFGARAGHLPASLGLAGFAPDDVTDILMTHLHIDHAGGLVDAAGAAVFKRARLHMAEAEAAHWRKVAAETANPDLSTKAASAALTAYGDRLRLFAPGARLRDGIAGAPLPGHTPGHTGFMIEDGGEKLLVWGDIIHSAALQFANADYGYAADVDGAQGVETRKRMFAQAADTALAVAGMHLPFPAVGTVTRRGGAFSFVPRAAG